MSISTRSACDFPFTFNNSVIELLKKDENSLNVTAEDCIQTYGAALGVGWLAYRIVLGSVFALFIIAFTVQSFRLRDFASKVHHSYFSLTQAKIYLTCLLISTIMVVQSIDPQGLENLISPTVSFISDELIAVLLFFVALLVTDFFSATAAAMGGAYSRGLGVRFKLTFAVFSIGNFVGLQIVAMRYSEDYSTYEACKMFGGVFLLTLLGAVAFKHVYLIQKALEDVLAQNSLAVVKPTWSESTKSFFTRGSQASKLSSFKAKTRKFFITIFVAIAIMLTNGLVAMTISNPSWSYSILEMPDYIQMSLKFLYSIVIGVVYTFFRVPKEILKRRLSEESETTEFEEERHSAFIARMSKRYNQSTQVVEPSFQLCEDELSNEHDGSV